MTRRLTLAMVLFAGCADAGGSTSTRQAPIVGGTIDNGDPAVVELDLGGGLCTGTVISPHVVLTAGHCISSSIRVYFDDGSSILSSAELDNPEIDMGLVALSSAAPVTPIPHNRTPLEGHLGGTVRIVGFGVTSETGSDSGVKRMGTASLDSLHETDEMWTTNDPQGTCYGDSGGPNFMDFGAGEVVAGVTTTGTSICGEGLDIATRADRQLDWIDSFVAQYDEVPSCGADGVCTPGCPDDPDCEDPPDPCAADGSCNASCTDDPDCVDEPSPDAGDPGDPGGDDDPATDDDPEDDDDVVTGGCSSSGGGSTGLVLGLMLGLVLRRLRHRRA